MDELLMYAVGEDILADADTLAEARGRLLQIVENLISSSLLLKLDDSTFIMHDIVRDAAISIASENGNNFIVKAGMGLSEWPQLKDVGHILRLSLISNHISVLPNQLSCQRLVTLSLARNHNLVSDEFFTGMTALTTLDLRGSRISSLPQSLSTLTDLRTLDLGECGSLVDVSMLGCLRNLEILNLSRCDIKNLPVEFKLLTNLKLLNLSDNWELKTIPPNVISSLSRLEELYLPLEFSEWETEGMEERKNACLSELSSLTGLSALHLHTKDVSLLYKDPPFQWKNLKEFKVGVGFDPFGDNCSNSLCISSVDDIKALAEWVRGLWGRNDLGLYVEDCDSFPNVIPVLHSSFNNLKILEIYNCLKMEYLVKMEEIGEQAILIELEELKLSGLSGMKGICSSGPIPIGSFNKLKDIRVENCVELRYAFPVSMTESLPQLESLEICGCTKMKYLVKTEELEELDLRKLSGLKGIWSSGPIPIGSFNKLKSIKVKECDELVHVFPVSMAESLPQLEILEIRKCNKMVQICSSGPIPIGSFHKLKFLQVENCDELVNVFPVSMAESLPQLETLLIYNCNKMVQICSSGPIPIGSFNKLKSIRVDNCDELVTVLPVSMAESLPQLESLEIRKCNKMVQICSSGPILKGSLNKLKSLKVEECDELVNVFPVSMAESLPQLKTLFIYNCNKMVQICSSGPIPIGSFNNLKYLRILNCEKMKYLVKMEEIGDEAILMELEELTLTCLSGMKGICSSGPIPIGSFNKLRILEVLICDKLVNLFPVSMAESLPQLLRLVISDCNEIVQIFGSEEEGCSQPPKIKAVFSQLHNLHLENLQNLSRFSSQSSVIFSFPSLESVTITSCPHLTRVPLGPESAPKVKVIELESDKEWQDGDDEYDDEEYNVEETETDDEVEDHQDFPEIFILELVA